MAAGPWSTKHIARNQTDPLTTGQEPVLRRVLGTFDLTALGIGAMIGTGIFVLTGTASAQYAGPAIALSFVLAGFGSLCVGLCYAEFASMIPLSGSAYTYSYAAFGEVAGWCIGWGLILEYLFGAATVAVTWSGYFVEFLTSGLGVSLPAALTHAPFTSELSRVPGAIANVPAILLVLLMTTLLVVGIKGASRFNNVIVAVKVAIIVLIIGLGFAYVRAENWHPFIPPNGGTFGRYGWSGVVQGAAVIFYAFIGFEAVSTVSPEAKNPERGVPVAILRSIAICATLYVLMALVITGLVHYSDLNAAHPVLVAVSGAGPGLRWLGDLVNVAALAGLTTVLLVLLMGQARNFFAMSRDGLLPPAFAAVHARFKTPHVATIATGVFAAAIAGFVPVGLIGEMVNLGALVGFAAVCVGLIVARYRWPNVRRMFRVPLVPLVPLLGLLFCFGVAASLPWRSWIDLVLWTAVGLVVYYVYGARHSRLSRAKVVSSE